jgi:hypothetical protein
VLDKIEERRKAESRARSLEALGLPERSWVAKDSRGDESEVVAAG